MTTELATQTLPVTVNLDRPMTAGDLTRQALLIQEILEKVMIGPTPENPAGVHYGIVPGTDKPTLLQPGAEKICATFHFAPKYAIEDLSEPHNNFYRYRVTCSLYMIQDGLFVGSACGEASSAEEKHSWQRAICDEQYEATDPSSRRVKYYADKSDAGFSTVKQIRRNAADLANTVLKIGCKRAYVSATRSATAASDLLEVDLEEEAVAEFVSEQRAEQAPKLKAKAPLAPLIPYGKHKTDKDGNPQRIDNPAVPLDYLQWMADKTGATLKEVAADPKHKRAKFQAQDQLFLAALDAEIAARKAAQPAETPKTPENPSKASPGDAQTSNPRGTIPKDAQLPRQPFSEAAWAEFIRLWEDDWMDLYIVTKEEFAIQSGHDLPAEKRLSFFDQMNAGIIAVAKK